MTLDFKLIDKSTQYSINSLESSKIICPGLLCIENVLDPELLLKLQTYIFDDNLTWGVQEHHDGPGYHYNRKKINWIPDSVIEETHIVLDGLTDYLNQRFNKKNKFLGLSIWKDEQSFNVPAHTDNSIIDLSMQIYLNSNNKNLGTKFYLGQNLFEIPYEVNCGYFMDNSYRIMHSYNGSLDTNYYRYSLYAVWTNTNK